MKSVMISASAMSLTPRALGWLKAAFLLGILGLAFYLPIWPFLVSAALLAWRHFIDRSGGTLPGTALRLLIALSACGAVYLQFGAFMGRDPGVSALVVLSAVKLLEVEKARDFHLMGYLCYFLTAAQFLFNQNLPVLLFAVMELLVVHAALLQLYAGRGEGAKPMRGAALLVMSSLPMAILLFLLFPRLPGPLWGLSGGSGGQGISGFSNTLEPGRVARMVKSEKPVFRVTFPEGMLPPPRQRYFRGLVLWLTNGRSWFQGRFREQIAGSPRRGGVGIRHEVIIEPHGRRWMFALDYAVQVPAGVRLLPGNVFLYHRRVEHLMRYRVRSLTGGVIEKVELHPLLRRMSLQLPRRVNPRLQALADTWTRNGADPLALSQKALTFFQEEGFRYSLEPGRLDSDDPIADFMLEKRLGFCGHYASAFSFMMRLCGVPARVVVGYQGGTVNPVDGRLVVRDSDAHAWSELWMEGRGWVRFDPTAAVVPERLEFGSRLNPSLEALTTGGGLDRSEALRRALDRGWVLRAWQRVVDYWEVAANYWRIWVVRYDRYQQRSFLMRLGARGLRGGSLLALMAAVVLFTWRLTRWIFRRPGVVRDPILSTWMKFLGRLERGGMTVPAWKGPVDIGLEGERRFPERGEEIRSIVNGYVDFRYGRGEFTGARVRDWRRRVRRFRVSQRD